MLWLVDATARGPLLRLLRRGLPWRYLGKDAAARERLAAEADSVPLGWESRLHTAAETLRRPYLDAVAVLGAQQPDPRTWWASPFASKSPFHSDFFLLVCYKTLAREALAEARRTGRDLVLVVEDPWLLADLRRDAPSGTRVVARPAALLRARTRLRVRGVAARVLAAVRLAREVRALGPAPVRPPRAATVALLGLAERRCFRARGFEDPYLGDLDALLRKEGHDVLRLLLPFHGPDLSPMVATVPDAWPLARALAWRDLALFLRPWSPRVPESFLIGDVRAAGLVRREVEHEAGRASFARARVTLRLLERFFASNPPRTLFFFAENQPWERMACLAARAVGVRTVAAQHSTIPKFWLSYFLGRDEARWSPLPDRLLVNGPLALRLLTRDGNYPPGLLAMGGTWRYGYLLRPPPRRVTSSRCVLVALPVDPTMARELALGCAEAARDAPPGWSFVVKPHPDVPLAQLGVGPSDLAPLEPSEIPFSALLDEAEVVVSHSTTSLEAWLRGKKVVRVRFEQHLDMDPLDGFDPPPIAPVALPDLAAALRSAMQAPASVPRPGAEVFSPVVPEAWLREAEEGAR